MSAGSVLADPEQLGSIGFCAMRQKELASLLGGEGLAFAFGQVQGVFQLAAEPRGLGEPGQHGQGLSTLAEAAWI